MKEFELSLPKSFQFLVGFICFAYLALSWPNSSCGQEGSAQAPKATRYPGHQWMEYESPAQAGFAPEKIDQLTEDSQDIGAAAVMVIHNGAVLFHYGNIDTRYMCHSIRKSYMSALYGIHVGNGAIDVNRTLSELGMDDRPPLTEQEKQAKIVDLLASRSGVYHRSAYEPGNMKTTRPARDSHLPGSHWWYNNWDFNALLPILEQATGQKFFEEFRRRFVEPLGMQDFRMRDGYYHLEPNQSLHPAYPLRMSARDMARFGWMMASGGRWEDEQIVPADWVELSTQPHSTIKKWNNYTGYGYMWWISELDGFKVFSALGNGANSIDVIPEKNLVFVFRADTFRYQAIDWPGRWRLIRKVLNAQTDAAVEDPEFVNLPSASNNRPTSAEMSTDYLEQFPLDLMRLLPPSVPETVRREPVRIDIVDETLVLYTRQPPALNLDLIPIAEDRFWIEGFEDYCAIERDANGDPARLLMPADMLREVTRLNGEGKHNEAREFLNLAVQFFPQCEPVLEAARQRTEQLENQRAACDELIRRANDNPRLKLQQKSHLPSQSIYLQGTYTVFENRETKHGRTIDLHLMVMPARGKNRQSDPLFILHGGPGAAATTLANRNWKTWERGNRDVVLIDQRGTGGSNPLHIRQLGSDDNLQTWFDSMFREDIYRDELKRLNEIADLTQYTTWNAVDDFDEVREALGYEKINLRGGSYGTRSALVYMRRHPETIRTATLQAVQPISYRNPLPHARSAQQVLDRIFAECRSTEEYRQAFPNIDEKFEEVLMRLDNAPVAVEIEHPVTGKPVSIQLDREIFAECVRVMMYSIPNNRRLPLLIMKAHEGDYRELLQNGLANNRGVRSNLAFGTLMSVTASEDISRIDESEIEEACRDTFIGEVRIRSQKAIADFWPKGKMPSGFADPVRVAIPTLLLSGSHDPSTTADWGEEAARHLPNSLHVVIPGTHGVGGAQVRKIERAFLESGTVMNLDVSEISKIKLPPLALPNTSSED